jgi:hypothetical protein
VWKLKEFRKTTQYGDNFMKLKKVYERVGRFNEARTDIVEDVRSWRPSTVMCIEIKEDYIDKRIWDNRKITTIKLSVK